MAALLALAVWMRLYNLGQPFDHDGYDEGVYWQTLRSMSAGYTLYQQIFYSQPPFFILSAYPFFALLGNTLWSARFGIAMLSHSLDASHPGSPDFEGTVVYAPPEQLQGNPQRNSDQYALAVVAYEWLTGEWPFTGTFSEIAHQHMFDLPPTLRRKGLDIPPEVEKIIMKALEKDPQKRFKNVCTFAEELEWASIGERTMLVQLQPKKQFRSPLPFVVKASYIL